MTITAEDVQRLVEDNLALIGAMEAVLGLHTGIHPCMDSGAVVVFGRSEWWGMHCPTAVAISEALGVEL